MVVALGKNQLERLLGQASPTSLLVVGSDRISRALVRRGLVKPKIAEKPNAWLQITPLGLRTLADALEAGQLEQFFKWPPGLDGKLHDAFPQAKETPAA